MLKILYVIVAILMLVFMIVVHEFGHYVAGKKLGFQINEFAIGFGPPIFKKKLKGGEQFSIRPIPLGGYCAFEGEDDEKDKYNLRAFNNKSPWKRIVVLAAGATFNFISAMLIITIYFCAYGESVSVVSTLYPSGVAATAETVREGDIILGVDGKVSHILMNDDFSKQLDKCGDTATLKILRDGKAMTVTINKGAYDYYAPRAVEGFYQYLYISNNEYKIFNLQSTDTLVEIDGKKVANMSAEKLAEKKAEMKSGTELKVSRNGTEYECFVTIVNANDRLMYINDVFLPPISEAEFDEIKNIKDGDVLYFRHIIDGSEYNVPIVVDQNSIYNYEKNVIAFDISDLKDMSHLTAVAPDAENPDGLETYNFGFTRSLQTKKMGFFRALGRSFTYSFFIVFKVLALFGALIMGKMSLSSAGGPITVISTVSEGIQLGGFQYLMFITCILSANLAVMNLLPIPALDGSKIVFTFIEWLRGKPINRKIEAIIHTVGLVVLFSFTIFVDIFHMVS